MAQSYPRPFRHHRKECRSDLPKTKILLRKDGTIIREGQDGMSYTPIQVIGKRDKQRRWTGVFDHASGADYIWDKETNSVWWSVDEAGCALGPPTSKHPWMEGEPLGRESAQVWGRIYEDGTPCPTSTYVKQPAEKNRVDGDFLLEVELYYWGQVPQNQCSKCWGKYRDNCQFNRACRFLHLVDNYQWGRIQKEGIKMKKLGIQSYKWSWDDDVSAAASSVSAAGTVELARPLADRFD